MRWPLTFALATTGIAIVFYYAPDADQDWVWITPGSIATTMLWVLFSMVFRLYVTTRRRLRRDVWRAGRRRDSTAVAVFLGAGAADRRRAEQRD